MALTAARNTVKADSLPLPSRGSAPLAATTTVFEGGMVCLDTSGRMVPASATAGLSAVVGRASDDYDNDPGAAGAITGEYVPGAFWWDNSGTSVTVADIGSLCYAVDDEAVHRNQSGSRPIAGVILDVDATRGVLVQTGLAVLGGLGASGGGGGAGGISYVEVTVTTAELNDADMSEDENIGNALPANAQVLGVDIRVATAFSGGAVSALVVDIGSTGDIDALVDGADVFSAPVDGQAATRPLGIAPNKRFATSTQLIARFLATGGNLADLTAGSCTIRVLYTVQP